MTKAQKIERDEAITSLRAVLKPGDTVYTILRHVSKSGMMREDNTMQINSFARGYIECALWASEMDYVGIDGLEDETVSALVADASAFETSCRDLLDQANDAGRDDEHLGHDFWLSRNRHGTGFWDRGLGDIGTHLHAMATPYGESNLYLGDDEHTVYLA